MANLPIIAHVVISVVKLVPPAERTKEKNQQPQNHKCVDSCSGRKSNFTLAELFNSVSMACVKLGILAIKARSFNDN